MQLLESNQKVSVDQEQRALQKGLKCCNLESLWFWLAVDDVGHQLFVALMSETDEATSQEKGKLQILNMCYGSIPMRGGMF